METVSNLLPEGVSLAVACLLVAASFATSLLTATLGVGGGLLMLALMASLLPAPAVVPVHGVVQLGSNASRALLLAASVAGSITLPFLIGSAAGAAVGALVVVELSPAALQLALGAFILWAAWGRPPTVVGRAALALSGALSSFLSMFVGATGPFVAAALKTRRLERQAHVATHAACMTGQHLVKVVAFGTLGFAFGPYLALIAAMILSGFAGTWVGSRLLRAMRDDRFHTLLGAVLTLLAVRLIWLGLEALVD